MVLKIGKTSVEFLRHASTIISFNGKNIFIDPWKLPENPPKADLVLISHEHFDHFDPQKISEISTRKTLIATNGRCSSKLGGAVETINAGDSKEFFGVTVTAREAYNIGKSFHPRGFGVGFELDFGSEKIYHAGDTDFIPQMRELKEIDVALLPIGGTYTMGEKEAAHAANAFKPRIAVPMHFNVVDGTKADPEKFASLLSKEIKCEILYR